MKVYEAPALYHQGYFCRVGTRVYALNLETVKIESLISDRSTKCVSFTTTVSDEPGDAELQSEFSMPGMQTNIFHQNLLHTQHMTSKGLVQQRYNLVRGNHIPPARNTPTSIPFLYARPLVLSTGKRLYFFQGKDAKGNTTPNVYSMPCSVLS